MSVRCAILGLLATEPMHGYAIQAALEEHFGDVCEPSYGEVYRALGALARDRLVAPASVRSGNRPRRKVYSLTADGVATLQRWLLGASVGARGRDDTWLRLLIAERVAPELLLRLLDVLVAGNRADLAELERMRRTDVAARSFADLVRALRRASDIRHARARSDALELCRATMAARLAGATLAALAHRLAGERGDAPAAHGDRPPSMVDPGRRS
jgi:DNA-binding PadR family transcriptional regulator